MADFDYDKWFEAAYLKFLPRMLKLAARRLMNISMAQEVVHDTFIVLWNARERVIEHPNLEGFLMKTLGNEILHKIRYTSRRKETSIDQDYPIFDQYSFDYILFFPSGITDDERRLLLWHYVQDIPYREIALRLGISEGTCRVRVYRAKQHYIELYELENRP